ncbi:transcription factor WEREWOLF, putative [Entamoeba dispar SAW760]|uniref:Transcription factor WEREWOLF, putative n=1 Tax=Entamoeba dispar (strain ATCC PRA-260 / SAW760) TaxID=370354 RepID=B0EKX5_ENTDS|nr:transcription factor WEREWOLF, putative [Entamoeba dispar SAW760]EDR24832.1 transcription factor WEREWOLF, putative [Entamoeba dispar SAW760]|eukprot:EDR24832.1 transcription factor WEREWOLF, putative [Entamoeba dispar SAW760]
MSTCCESSSEKRYSRNKKIVRTWSKEEDQMLLSAIETFGNNWNEIAKAVPSRSRKQCRERFLNNLSNTNEKKQWTMFEDAIILSQRNILGNKWTQISQYLNGRSPNAVKNRYFGHLKRLGITESDITASVLSQKSISAFAPVCHELYCIV